MFSAKNIEVDGRINGRDDADTSDGEGGAGGHNMVSGRHAHSLFFPYILYLFF